MTRLSKIFGIDLRSLAAFRVALALFILYDLISRSMDLTAHYTDFGAVPREWAARYFSASPLYQSWNPATLSVHMFTGSAFGTALLFIVQGIAAIALLLGFRTRLMTFIVWFLVASLHTRNALVLSVGDDVLRVLLFFSIFLPLGARYSIDHAMNTEKEAPNVFVSAGSVAYYLQFIGIYFFSALLKSGPEWHRDGTALYYAFNIDQFALPLAKTLLGHPSVLRFLTVVSWWIELAGGFLLLMPVTALRIAGIILFVGLQVGIGLTLALGHNPWINVTVLLPFLPSVVWDRKARSRPAVEIIYDGNCGFCRTLLSLLLEFLRPPLAGVPAPAQGKDLATMRRENSWIVRTKDEQLYRFDALIAVVSASPIFFWKAPLMRIAPVRALGTSAYKFVADNRNPLGKLLSPIRLRPMRVRTGQPANAVVLLCLAIALLYNVTWFAPFTGLRRIIEFPAELPRLEQYWGMFAPAPNRDDGWFIVEGKLRSGAKVDALRGAASLDESKPAGTAGFYANERWRRYMMNIATRDYKDFRPPLAEYLCRNWNTGKSGADHLEQIDIYFMQEVTPPPGTAAVLNKLHLAATTCAP